ncbi:sigma-70 family RNA polymerase sigma factor [Nocardioides sp. InS609-2]|uniref:sigma-70 family RNA polymerase sigma factor n=1 Tax=Nocardioides sp. InS609-2 TaxID=2760705 RepID=UPI0020BD6983|nr:sigma-70 family RNA polymerase sigma factor [Nocardioides sp. InS609-2]
MRDPEEFDAFYKNVRDRVLLETYALTGDLPVSRAAVRDAFAVAWHHWRKVSRLDDPEAWLRPLAWGRAQRRHTARIWHREKDLDDAAKTTLDALAKLSVPQRKALILTNLSPLSLLAISRAVGLPQTDVERELQTATAQFAISRDTGTTEIRGHLEHLRTVTDTAQWPRVSIVRRAGAARRRTHTLVGVAGTALVLIAGGTFVSQGNTSTASLDDENFDSPSAAVIKADDGPTLKDDVLLATADLDLVDSKMSWVEARTDDNAAGNGLALPCQIQRYADPEGSGAFVRTFEGTGPKPKPVKTKAKKNAKAVPPAKSAAWELVELSGTEKAAQAAYSNVNSWYAGCLAERTQLLSVHRVGQVGDDARVFTLRSWRGSPRTLRVGVARSGQLTVTTVSRVDGLQLNPSKPAALLAAAVNRVCSAPGGNACAGEPALKEIDAPVAGLVPGMLSEFDLPPIARAPGPWIGTEPVKAKVNVASTRCDRTEFTGKSVRRNLTRTFLFPAVDKANEFGLTETVGIWSPGNARTFVKDVRRRVDECAENAFGTEVRQLRNVADENTDVTAWNISMEISDKDSVQFLMAIVRSEGTVAQVGFVPSQAMSMDREDFLDVVDRAVSRLPQLRAR